MTTGPARRRVRVAVYHHVHHGSRRLLDGAAERLVAKLRDHLPAHVSVEVAGFYLDVGGGKRDELRRLLRDARDELFTLVLVPRFEVLGATPPDAAVPMQALLDAGALTITEAMVAEWAPRLVDVGEEVT